MKKEAKLLKAYLDDIGFDSIYKNLSGLRYYFSPLAINQFAGITANIFDKIAVNQETNWDLLKCLVFCSEIEYSSLSQREKNIADQLIKLGILKKVNSELHSKGMQLISANGSYLLIDGRINFPKLGAWETYIASDSYIVNFYIEQGKINKNSRCLDIGTGTGNLALYLSGFSDEVLATDITEQALYLSNINRYLNNRDDKLTIVKEDIETTVNRREAFDIITSNPPSVPYPSDLAAPVIVKGCNKDGLGYVRMMFRKFQDMLTPQGSAYLIMTLYGDETQPYFINELEMFSKEFHLSIDVFIEYKGEVDEARLEGFATGIKRENTHLSEKEMWERIHSFKEELKMEYFYMCGIIVRRSDRGFCVRLFDRYTTHPKDIEVLSAILGV